MNIKKLVLGLSTAACFCSSAFATPIPFSVDLITITPGSGYGTGSEEKLDVAFTLAPIPAGTSLDMAGTTVWTFNLGKVELKEECINPGGCPKPTGGNNNAAGDETDNLNVTVAVHFVNPLTGDQSVIMTGTAQAGLVDDKNSNAPADYTLAFASKDVLFGNGGKFNIGFSGLSFYSLNESHFLQATVTLLAPPIVAPSNNVPEPASLALMGLGLAGIAYRGKRRKA